MSGLRRGVFLLCLGLFLGGALWVLVAGDFHRQTRAETVLVVGLDESEGLPDTLLLVALPPRGGAPRVLSIPRDTLVPLPAGADRINHAWRDGGVKGVKRALMALAGIPVDRHVVLQISDLARVVDTLGGVEVDVPKRLFYEDEAQGLRIDLQAGRQTLDGEEAVAFARFRSDALGDIGRVARQQALGHAVLSSFREASWARRWLAVARTLRGASTSLQVEEVLVMAMRTKGAAPVTEILPGAFLGPYWAPDTVALRAWVEGVVEG